jgi:hypothetical protein
MYPTVKSVEPLESYRLLIEFDNGQKRVFDVSPYLNLGRFAELKEPSMFRSVRVSFDTIEWANHLDIDPELLYEQGLEIAKEGL